jgi:hypothetical protein
VPPRRFPSGYVDGVRPSHHMNNTKTKFANPWPSFRLVAVDVYSSPVNLCRFQTFFQLLSVRDFARDASIYCLIKHYTLGDPSTVVPVQEKISKSSSTEGYQDFNS